MIRLLGFFLKLGLLVAFAVWVADHSGRVTIEWKDKIVETSTLLLVLGVVFVAMLSYSIAKLFSYFHMAAYRLKVHRQFSQQRKADYLLSSAVTALADEKKKRALTLLERAERLIGASQVVEMVRSQAQAGEPLVISDHGDYGSPFAWREAIERSLKEGRVAEARQLAESFAAKHESLALPKKMLFEVYTRDQNWDGALRMLDILRSSGDMSRHELRLARAAVLAERARLALDRGQKTEAFEYARQADRLHPHWVPSLLLAARGLALQDKPREAASLIEKSWALAPHPQLGALYLSLKTGKNDVKKAQAVENMARRVEHPASQLLLAEALLRAGIYAQARFTASELAKTHPSREVFALLARIEEAEHHGASARDWHDKANASPLSEAWMCTACRQPHKNWQALCSSCREFNTLAWQSQPAVIAEQ